MTVYRLSDIKPDPVVRLQTKCAPLNFIYGSSEINGKTTCGLPIGKISLWGGEGGIGKSRLALDIAKDYSKNNKVLVIQTEASLNDFASWAKNSQDYPNLYCSGTDTFQEILKAIYEVEPKLIVIDSINEVQEFNGRDASPIIKSFDGQLGANGEVLEPCTLGLREVVADVGAHCIILAQLTTDGKIKGGTSLPHLVDAVLNLRSDKDLSDNEFMMRMGKNRYGKKGGFARFLHVDCGVFCIYSIMDEIAPVVAPVVPAPVIPVVPVIPPRPSYGDYPISKKTLDDIDEWDRLYDPETWAEMERAMAIGAAKIAHRNSPTHRAAGAIVNGIRSLGNLGGWLP